MARIRVGGRLVPYSGFSAITKPTLIEKASALAHGEEAVGTVKSLGILPEDALGVTYKANRLNHGFSILPTETNLAGILIPERFVLSTAAAPSEEERDIVIRNPKKPQPQYGEARYREKTDFAHLGWTPTVQTYFDAASRIPVMLRT